MVDVADSKSADGDIVWVRVPPPAPMKMRGQGPLFFIGNKNRGLEPEGAWRHAGGMSQPEVACAAAQVESHHRHHVRRTQLHSVSAVCVRAAKTAHPLSPSSFPKSNPLRWASIWISVRIWIRPARRVRRTQLRSVSAVCVRAAKTAHPLRPSSFPESDPLRWAPIRIFRAVRIWITPAH